MSSAFGTTCRRCETPLSGGRICSACKRKREAVRRTVGHILAALVLLPLAWGVWVLCWCVGGH